MTRRFIPALLALVLLALVQPTQAQVTLKWKLAKGEKFDLVSETTTKSVTTTTDQFGNNNKEEETETENVTRLVEITEVTSEGNFKMLVTMVEMEKVSKSAERTMTFSAKKDAEGKKSVSVNINAKNPLLGGRDVKALMEKLASNLLDYKMMFEITPQGVVLSAKGEGDPFADLPEDTQVTKMISKTVRRMLNPDDLPQMAAAEAFAQLPEQPVQLAQDWPLRRAFTVMGLSMDGRGTTILEKVQDEDGQRIATLQEKMVYKVDATKFNKMLKELMEGIFADAGLPVKLSVHLKATNDIDATATSLFNISQGHTTSTTWSGLTIPFGGTMTINVAGQQNTVSMDLQVTVETKNTWKKK